MIEVEHHEFLFDWCYGLNILCHSQTSYVELSSKLMISGDVAFGRCMGHEDGALMNGLSALFTGDPKEPPSPFHQRRNVIYLPDFEMQSFQACFRRCYTEVCGYSSFILHFGFLSHLLIL